MTTPTVLVLGANGRFGQAAVTAFATAGWRVLAQVRRAPQRALSPTAQALNVPLHDIAALAAQAAGATVVVHALNPPYTRWPQEVLPLARLGMDLALRLDARFMLPGNVYNFGDGMPALLAPDTPQQPGTRKGRIRCELEVEMCARASLGLRSVVLRAGDFFGSGTGSWLDRVVVKSLAQRKLVYPGPLDVPHAWAYLPDLARAFVALAERGPSNGFTNLHFAGHTLTGAQLLHAVQCADASLGLNPAAGWRIGQVPWALLRVGAPLLPMWRELVEIEYLWRVPHALDGTALQMSVGALPATAIDAALRAALIDIGLGAVGAARPSGVNLKPLSPGSLE